jgi:hypothetical protein
MSTVPSTISWRKIILLNRSALLSAWPWHFPRHDFGTLRLSLPPIVPWPNEEAWRQAARAYHEDRKRRMRR